MKARRHVIRKEETSELEVDLTIYRCWDYKMHGDKQIITRFIPILPIFNIGEGKNCQSPPAPPSPKNPPLKIQNLVCPPIRQNSEINFAPPESRGG